MELRHLRYFLEVARTLHFGTAAEQLNIAAPTLSVQISQLEHEFGTPLFIRTKRSVRLTQAGEILREEAEATLRQAAQARERVLGAARGERGYIRTGYVASALWSGVLGSVLSEFKERHPHISVRVREVLMDTMAAQLTAGAIDIAFVRGPMALPAEIGHVAVHHDHFCLALPAAHPLSKAEDPIAPDQLRDETFILPEQSAGTEEVAGRGGFILHDTIRSGILTEVLANVALNNGIAVIPAVLAKTVSLPNVVYRDMAQPEIPSVVWMLYRKWERTPLIKQFIAATRKALSIKAY